MTTPDPGTPAPTPEGDGHQERSTPGSPTPWGASPWSGPPAPSGYEAQLPGASGSSTGAPGGAGAAPASPYAAPVAQAAPGAGTPGPGTPPVAPRAGYPQAALGGFPPAAPGGGFPPAGPYGTPPPDPYAAASSPGSPYPYPAGPYGAPYPAAPYGTGAYPAWAPPQPRETDGLAIASLVVSCSSFVVGLTAPVGLGLGVAALRRIRRTGAQGRGLAIAGVVVGGIMTAAAVAMVAFFVLFVATAGTWATTSGSSSSWDDGTSTMPSYVLRTDLVPGDCLVETPGTYDMTDAVVVDCAQPHAGEVLSTLPMADPVSTDLNVWDPAFTDLVDRCDADASALLGTATLAATGWTEVYYPHPDEWADGGRTAFCLLGSISEATGSAVAGSYTVGAQATT